MCRVDLSLTETDFSEILKWAKCWQPELAEIIESTMVRDKSNILLSKDKVLEELACDLLCDFMDAETNGYTREDSQYFSRLVELWRPVAEGSLGK